MLIIINVLFSGFLGTVVVQRNRGQIIEKPEWKLIPQLTANGVFFLIAFVVSGIYEYINVCNSSAEGIFIVAILTVITGVIIFAFVMILGINKTIQFIKNKQGDGKNNENIEGCNGGNFNDGDIQQKFYRDIVGYMDYTMIYLFKCLDIISIVEIVIVFWLMGHKDKNIEIVLNDFNWELITEKLVISMIFSSLWGLVFVGHRSIIDSHVTSEKTKRNRILQMKKNLESESIRN